MTPTFTDPRAVAVAADTGSGTDSSDSDDTASDTDTAAATHVKPSLLFRFKVVATYPSDVNAFVQGLTFDEGAMLMGTGIWGKSSIRRIDYTTGNTTQIQRLPRSVFGEGIAVLGDHIFQLTYQSDVAFVYNRTTFEKLATLQYPHDMYEGWGITADPHANVLFISDGSEHIRITNTQFKVLSKLRVHDPAGRSIKGINELEFVGGELLANVYGSDCVLRISPITGEVIGWIVGAGLYPDNPDTGLNVLNGIAFDPHSGKLLITGKMWPHVFEVIMEAAPDLQGSLQQCAKHPMTLMSMMRASMYMSTAPVGAIPNRNRKRRHRR